MYIVLRMRILTIMKLILSIFCVCVVTTLSIQTTQAQVECSSTADCNESEICSTERGDCNPPANCKEGEVCPTLCVGYCIEQSTPFTVGTTLTLNEAFITSNCSTCIEYLWLNIYEGLDRNLPKDSLLNIHLEEYSVRSRLFSTVDTTVDIVTNATEEIDSISLSIPKIATNGIYPHYRYFKLIITYQDELFTWVIRSKRTNDQETPKVDFSSLNPSQEEFSSLLQPPRIEATVTPLVFPDVVEGSLLDTSLDYLTARSIISGNPDGTFRPFNRVNRAEAAKFLLNSKYGIVSARPEQLFPDVPLNVWFTPFVTFAYKQGIIRGYSDLTFKPEQTVNTAEFLKMVTLTFDLETNVEHGYIDVDETDWFNAYAGTAKVYDLFPKRVAYRLYPDMLLTREEVAIAMYKILINQANQ